MFFKEKKPMLTIPPSVFENVSNNRLANKIALLESNVRELEYQLVRAGADQEARNQIKKLMNHLNLEFYTEPAKSGIREKQAV